MKGPSGRLKFDVRRLWKCPRCGHQDRLHARIVNQPCQKCAAQGTSPGPVWMTLIEEVRPKAAIAQVTPSTMACQEPERP